MINKNVWEIKRTPDRGRGVFATNDIKPGEVIGDYLGKIYSSRDNPDNGKQKVYSIEPHEDYVYYPDPESVGIHLINHSCMPNCGMYVYQNHVLYFSLRKIFAGEEFLVDYMIEPDPENANFAVPCKCFTSICRGTMMASLGKIRSFENYTRSVSKKVVDSTPRYGSIVEPLEKYPDTIPDHQVFDIFGAPDRVPLKINTNELSIPEIRNIIRESGRILFNPRLKIKTLGIINSLVIKSF